MLNVDRFEQYLAEGRLVRNAWNSIDAQGRHTACWLAALSDEVAYCKTPAACPAEDLPEWFAELIPWMDDHTSDSAWAGFAQRLGAALRKKHDWSVLLLPTLAVIVREVLPRAGDTTRQVQSVLTLLEQGGSFESFTNAADAANVAHVAYYAAHDAVDAAAARAADTAVYAACAAADNATNSAGCVISAGRAAARTTSFYKFGVHDYAEYAAAVDRITDGILKLLEVC